MSSKREVNVERKNDNSTVRVRTTSDGKVFLDNYSGDVEDPNNHDRFTVPLNDGIGKPTGHGFNHEKWKEEDK